MERWKNIFPRVSSVKCQFLEFVKKKLDQKKMTDEKTGEEAAAPALPVDSEKTIALKEKIKAAFALFDKEAKGCVVQ